MNVTCANESACEGQRATLRSWFSPTTLKGLMTEHMSAVVPQLPPQGENMHLY